MRNRPAGFWRAVSIGVVAGVACTAALAGDASRPNQASLAPVMPGALETSPSTRYPASPPGPVLDRQSLEPLLKDLVAIETPTLWDRLLSWLEEVLGRQPDARLPDWIPEAELPWDWVFYFACVLVVVLSVAIIANELRLRQRGRRGRPLSQLGAAPRSEVEATLDQLAALPLRDQPAALLRMILARGRLAERPGNRFSMTHGEVAATAAALPAVAVEPMQRMAATAERIRYSGRREDEAEVSAAVADGRRVLEALER